MYDFLFWKGIFMSIYGYLYLLSFNNGKIYIGKTSMPLKKRYLRHVSSVFNDSLTNCLHAFIKQGPPEIKLIAVCEPGEYLDKLEMKAIAFYKSTDPNTGYNTCSKGTGPTSKEKTCWRTEIDNFNPKPRSDEEFIPKLFNKITEERDFISHPVVNKKKKDIQATWDILIKITTKQTP